jgi:hypothetical protein
MILRIFSSFCSSEICKEKYENLCETNRMVHYGKDKKIYITCDDNYTHAIILNTAMPTLTIPKENVIGFAFEPPQYLGITHDFIEYAKKHIHKYFIGDKYDLPLPFIEYHGFMWHIQPPSMSEPPYIKTGRMSIMVSNKKDAPGHKYRHMLVEQILQTDLPVDIYGRGCMFYHAQNDQRIRGSFAETEPYESYEFHICIENFQTKHYFSEKIMNSLLCDTTPIYLGCSNIDNYFPGSVISLSGKINEDIAIIRQIIENPSTYRKKINVEDIKEKINMLKHLGEFYSKGRILF